MNKTLLLNCLKKKKEYFFFLIFCFFVLFYIQNLNDYLKDLTKPGLLFLAFIGSLMFSLYQDLKNGFSGKSVTSAIVSTIVFTIGVLFAEFFRYFYTEMVKELSKTQEIIFFLGPDYYEAMSNKTVGYGSCFGLGILFSRFIIGTPILSFFMKIFKVEDKETIVCQHCGKATKI